MNCQTCNQVIEAGAAFCGNCGQPVQATAVPVSPPASPQQISTIAQVMQNQPGVPAAGTPGGPLTAANTASLAAGVPGYALAVPGQHSGESKALLALLFGIAGIAGGLFMALIGLALGIAGLVMGTMSRSSAKRGLSTAGLVLSSLAVLVGLGVWAYAIKNDPALQKNTSASQAPSADAPTVSASGLSTPCYSAGFVDKLNVSNSDGSCDMSAFNGPTIDNSTNAYKISANQSQAVNAKNFTGIVKPALEKDIKDNLAGFTISSEQATEFAGSPAYVVNTSDEAADTSVVEAAVLHQEGNGENVFILVHVANASSVDLSTLEAQWQWK